MSDLLLGLVVGLAIGYLIRDQFGSLAFSKNKGREVKK